MAGAGTAMPGGAFFFGLVLAAVAGTAGFYALRRSGAGRRDALRAGGIGATGALLGFNYLALGLPGSDDLMVANAYLSLVLFCAAGGAAGVIAAGAWWKRGWQR